MTTLSRPASAQTVLKRVSEFGIVLLRIADLPGHSDLRVNNVYHRNQAFRPKNIGS
jgi:hypothetical protein